LETTPLPTSNSDVEEEEEEEEWTLYYGTIRKDRQVMGLLSSIEINLSFAPTKCPSKCASYPWPGIRQTLHCIALHCICFVILLPKFYPVGRYEHGHIIR
jgi:hypothetical protein